MIQESLVVPEIVRQDANVAFPPTPVLGDVIDALDDATASLRTVVRNRTRSVVEEARNFVRAQPLTSIAIAVGVAYLSGRLRR